MKSAENNCGEGRNGSALRPHFERKKPRFEKSYLILTLNIAIYN